MKGSRKVLLGAVSNWLRFVVSALVALLLVPVMTRSFGGERYGLWVLSSSLLGFLQSLDAGFGAGTVKWTAESRSPEDAGRRDELLSTSLAVHLAASAIGTIAVLVLSLLFSGIFSIPGNLAPEGRILFLLLGLRVTAVGIPAGFLRGLVFGSDRLFLLNSVQIVSSVAYGAAVWALLASGVGTIGIAAAGLGLSALEMAAVYVAARHAMNQSETPIRLSLRRISSARFREAFSYSGSSFMVQVSSAVLMQSDLIILKFFAPLAVVAGYGVAGRAAEYGFILVKQAVNALTPSIARLDPAREPEKARFFLTNASKYSGALAGSIAVASWSFGGPLLAAWAGPGYEAYGTILGILTTAFVIISVQMPCAAYLSLKGDHVWSSRAMTASALINIAVSIILAFALGPIGIALGTLVASLLIDGLVLPLRAYRSIGLRGRDLLLRVWIKLVLPAALQCGAMYGLGFLLPSRDLGTIAIIGAIGIAAFGASFALLSLDGSERRLFLGGGRKAAS
ncbi:MAG: polysaccharide biosynthesis C-terminal domain-containing protein [Spirochaetota bacterium]